MESIVATIRPLLELLYFIAGIILTIGVGITYKQLTLLNAESVSRSRRVSAEKAIEASDIYFMKYVPLAKKYLDEKKSSGINNYNGPIGDFSTNSLPKEIRSECFARFKLQEWLPSMNCLESIAARFTSGVADEKVGFPIIGRTFCGTVENMYDLIAISRTGEPVGYWSNVVSLYKIWRPRLTEAELSQKREELDGRLSTFKSTTIPPLK